MTMQVHDKSSTANSCKLLFYYSARIILDLFALLLRDYSLRDVQILGYFMVSSKDGDGWTLINKQQAQCINPAENRIKIRHSFCDTYVQ